MHEAKKVFFSDHFSDLPFHSLITLQIVSFCTNSVREKYKNGKNGIRMNIFLKTFNFFHIISKYFKFWLIFKWLYKSSGLISTNRWSKKRSYSTRHQAFSSTIINQIMAQIYNLQFSLITPFIFLEYSANSNLWICLMSAMNFSNRETRLKLALKKM